MTEQKIIKVWVLEDDKEDRELIEEAFINSGIKNYEILEKTSELFNKFKLHLDVMVVDFHLKPDLEDGDRVVQKIKYICNDCYAIIISTLETKKEFIRVIRAHADDYIDKSENNWPDELVKAVKIGMEKVGIALDRKKREDTIKTELYKYQQEIKERIHSKQNPTKYDSRPGN